MTAKLQLTRPIYGKKHRVHDWVDINNMTMFYGVQCNVEYGAWAHVILGDAVFLTRDRDDAKEHAKRWSIPVLVKAGAQ